MKTINRSISNCLLLLFSTIGIAAFPILASQTPLPDSEVVVGFVRVFNGSDYTGLQASDNSSLLLNKGWHITPENTLRCDHGGGGGPNIMFAGEYKNFILRFQWRNYDSLGFDGGLLIRSPSWGDIFHNQIQMGTFSLGGIFQDSASGDWTKGNWVYGSRGWIWADSAGKWNSWEISVKNGVQVSLTFDSLGHPAGWKGTGKGVGWTTDTAARKYIGFQWEGGGYEMRNIRIKSLDASPTALASGAVATQSAGAGFFPVVSMVSRVYSLNGRIIQVPGIGGDVGMAGGLKSGAPSGETPLRHGAK